MTQLNKLSNREWEVVKLLLQGKSNKLIALSLGISEHTVEFHLTNIYAKFQVSSRIELILKLGNSTGEFETEKLGSSPVDNIRKSAQNRDRLNLWMGRATMFAGHTVAITGKVLKMKRFLNLKTSLMLVISLLLLFVNWLAFHDLGESHTVRDWLILTSTVLVLFTFAHEFWNRYFRKARSS